MQKNILILLLSIPSLNLFAQESDFLKDFERKHKRNEGKDFHQNEALSIDELMAKKNYNQLNSLRKKKNYLVYEYLITAKRKPYFEGDIFRFKTKKGERYDQELAFIDDSTFTISSFDSENNTFTNQEFSLNEIKKIYKRPPYKFNLKRFGLHLLEPAGLILYAAVSPKYVNLSSQLTTLAFVMVGKHGIKHGYRAVTKSRRLKNNRRIRILKTY